MEINASLVMSYIAVFVLCGTDAVKEETLLISK